MVNLQKMNLGKRLSLYFILAAVVPVACLALALFIYGQASLKRSSLAQLDVLRKLKASRVTRFVEREFGALDSLANAAEIQQAVEDLQEYHAKSAAVVEGDFPVGTPEYAQLRARLRAELKHNDDLGTMDNLFLVCANHGHVMFALHQSLAEGKRLAGTDFHGSKLSTLWQQTVETGRRQISDLFQHPQLGRTPSFYLSAPVSPEGDTMQAVLVLQVESASLNSLMASEGAFGESGETYLVGDDQLMRTESRALGAEAVLKTRVEGQTAVKAMEQAEGNDISQDYRGVPVLSSYSHLGLDEAYGCPFDWYILAEIDQDEAYGLIRELRWLTLGLSLSALVVAAVVGIRVARGIAVPISGLADAANQVAGGNLMVELDLPERGDEVGALVASFRTMTDMLRGQTRQVQTSAHQLGAAISEISATAMQLAASSSETSAAVTEVGTTVEEVRQTSQVSSEKARDVADDSGELSATALDGRAATDDALAGMARIKEEMDYVAESTVQLSEQTQSIGEIIGTVTDLADQSNLLSVNAAIEAAKAGEYGKGFAVVAQEVRSLADQSKEATKQIRTILNDIQQATSAAVMATERASKSVSAGSKLAGQAGQAIRDLADGVEDSANAALQIAASNQEQLAGIDQLVVAIRSIDEASTQNLTGASQLEEASRSLDQLGHDLNEMAGRFQI